MAMTIPRVPIVVALVLLAAALPASAADPHPVPPCGPEAPVPEPPAVPVGSPSPLGPQPAASSVAVAKSRKIRRKRALVMGMDAAAGPK